MFRLLLVVIDVMFEMVLLILVVLLLDRLMLIGVV